MLGENVHVPGEIASVPLFVFSPLSGGPGTSQPEHCRECIIIIWLDRLLAKLKPSPSSIHRSVPGIKRLSPGSKPKLWWKIQHKTGSINNETACQIKPQPSPGPKFPKKSQKRVGINAFTRFICLDRIHSCSSPKYRGVQNGPQQTDPITWIRESGWCLGRCFEFSSVHSTPLADSLVPRSPDGFCGRKLIGWVREPAVIIVPPHFFLLLRFWSCTHPSTPSAFEKVTASNE